jgi:hypothetical protein
MAKRGRHRPPPQTRPVLVLQASPSTLPLIARLLDSYCRRYRRGDKTALLLAIDTCAAYCIPLPPWAAEAIMCAIRDWLVYRVATLDEAFSVARRGKHVAAAREREALRPIIMLRIGQLYWLGEPLDQGTFTTVAEEIGKSVSYVAAIYRERASSGWRKTIKSFHISRKS